MTMQNAALKHTRPANLPSTNCFHLRKSIRVTLTAISNPKVKGIQSIKTINPHPAITITDSIESSQSPIDITLYITNAYT